MPGPPAGTGCDQAEGALGACGGAGGGACPGIGGGACPGIGGGACPKPCRGSICGFSLTEQLAFLRFTPSGADTSRRTLSRDTAMPMKFC
ncbi:hypothetical protein DMA15_14630 [Streptomyces sp. WAC 01529]|nr:hypothetical protein DMA15_14630 [Streptomyces sp. WAC 01529]